MKKKKIFEIVVDSKGRSGEIQLPSNKLAEKVVGRIHACVG